MGHHEKAKPRNNKDRRRRSPTQSTENIFDKIIEEIFPNLKKDMHVRIQEVYKHQINWTSKVPLLHKNQNTKHTE